MTTRKLSSVDAFVVVDLDGDHPAAGLVRLAPKILVDGAAWLARTATYQFASFERKVSGASAGINAPVDGRAEAIVGFAAEIEPDAASGALLLHAGRGVGDDELIGLRAVDARPDAWWEQRHQLEAEGVAVAAALGGGGSLEGRTVAIEGFGPTGAALAAAIESRGGRVVAVATAAGTLVGSLAATDLAEAWLAHGPALVSEMAGEPASADAVLGAEADVLVVGSKSGVLDHEAAAHVRASVVVPGGPIPVTAKALAVLRRAEVVVLPDFVTTAGHLAAWPEAGTAPAVDLPAAAVALVEGALGEVLAHPSGPLLGACERAEAFLRTWCDSLPFGRPLA